MQAVILIGGLGTRLSVRTRDTPKPLVSVAGRLYLEHQLRLLRRQAITDVPLLTGYLGESIERRLTLFFTGTTRATREVLGRQRANTEAEPACVTRQGYHVTSAGWLAR